MSDTTLPTPQTKVLTSAKVDKQIYEQFKANTAGTHFHLQDLLNRSLYLFNTDENFRATIKATVVPVLSSEVK